MQPVPSLLRILQSPSVAFPLLIAGICGILLNLAGGNEFRTLICIYAIALTLPQYLVGSVFPFLQRLLRRSDVRPLFVVGMLVGLTFALTFFVGTHPADAQMFVSADKWIQSTLLKDFPNAGPLKNMFALFINIIRFLFILYMGFSLVQVIQALRRDEEWGKLAQVPLIVLIAAMVADLATGFILNGSGGSSAG